MNNKILPTARLHISSQRSPASFVSRIFDRIVDTDINH